MWSRDNSVSIATRYGLDGQGSNLDGGEIFRTCPDRPWGPPNLLYNRYRVFPGGKAAGAWRWQPTPTSAEVKERLELYLYSPSGSSWHVVGWPLHFTFTFTCGQDQVQWQVFGVTCVEICDNLTWVRQLSATSMGNSLVGGWLWICHARYIYFCKNT